MAKHSIPLRYVFSVLTYFFPSSLISSRQIRNSRKEKTSWRPLTKKEIFNSIFLKKIGSASENELQVRLKWMNFLAISILSSWIWIFYQKIEECGWRVSERRVKWLSCSHTIFEATAAGILDRISGRIPKGSSSFSPGTPQGRKSIWKSQNQTF